MTASFPPPTDGTGHSKERHEPTSARVHGDVLHEEGPGCSDGDLQETHHPERRKVTPPGLLATMRGGGAVCGSDTPESFRERAGVRERDERRVVFCLPAVPQRRPQWRRPTRGRATRRPRLLLQPPTFNLQGSPDNVSAGGDLHRTQLHRVTLTRSGCFHHADVTAAASSCTTPPTPPPQHNTQL